MRGSSRRSRIGATGGGGGGCGRKIFPTTALVAMAVVAIAWVELLLVDPVESFAVVPERSSFSSFSSSARAGTEGGSAALRSAPSGGGDPDADSETSDPHRRAALARIGLSPLAAATAATAAVVPPHPAPARAAAEGVAVGKQTNLSERELLSIVVDTDLVENQFLVSGRLTRSVYDESATFRDEIDTYGLDQWTKGTARLFDASRSRVVLVPGSVETSPSRIELRFVEYLCFNVPLLKPIVYLSGTLVLERSTTTGLITAYRERWDQDIYKVLTSESKLFTSGLSMESLDADLDAFFDRNANGNNSNNDGPAAA